MWLPLGSYLCKHADNHSVTTEACSSLHLTCLCVCGMAAWKFNGAICAMTATTDILSRMCRQVWFGTFGICRSHARAPIPMQTKGAFVCMSRRDMPVHPSDVITCRRSCAEPGSGLFAVHFLPHDATFSIHRCCQAPSCRGNWRVYTSSSSGQNALRPWPWWYFVDHEILFYSVQRVNISKLISKYLQQNM